MNAYLSVCECVSVSFFKACKKIVPTCYDKKNASKAKKTKKKEDILL